MQNGNLLSREDFTEMGDPLQSCQVLVNDQMDESDGHLKRPAEVTRGVHKSKQTTQHDLVLILCNLQIVSHVTDHFHNYPVRMYHLLIILSH